MANKSFCKCIDGGTGRRIEDKKGKSKINAYFSEKFVYAP